jgi:hypothetical protein
MGDHCQDGDCRPGTPANCDDHERCTADACDPARGCSNVPLGGIAAVTCHLDAVDDALGAGGTDQVTGAARRRLDRTLTAGRRRLVDVTRALQVPAARRRATRSADRALRRAVRAITVAERRGQLAPALAAALAQRLAAAARALGTL